MMQDTIGHLNIQKQAEKFCDSSSNKFKLNPSLAVRHILHVLKQIQFLTLYRVKM